MNKIVDLYCKTNIKKVGEAVTPIVNIVAKSGGL